MTKNIIVTDKDGNVIGSTYPKRAKGLVKNGRAEYAGDRTIRLLHTQVPAVNNNFTEVITMSNTINFNARDFRFDETCQSLDGAGVNAGQRAFVTMSFGNTEVWEIGDWRWTWSQIKRSVKLEKNTDCVFCFSMEGGICSTDDAVTVVHIAPKDGWEERYTFPLDHNKFMPVVCVRDGNELLRSFELPFNSGEYEDWVIRIAAQHAVARFMAPVSYTAVSKMEPVSYEQFCGKAAVSVSSSDGVNIAFESREFDETTFTERLVRIGDGCNVGFENVTVHPDAVMKELSAGNPADGCNISFENCTLTARAMSLVISKAGDGCNFAFENVTVTEEGIDDLADVGDKADGANFALENVTIPKCVLDLFFDKMGDGSNIFEEGVSDYEVYESLPADLVTLDTETGEISQPSEEELKAANEMLEKSLEEKLIDETIE